jgi:type IV secretion system protein VirD4
VWSPLSASTTWTGSRRTSAALLGVGEHRPSQSADDAFWRPAGARYLAALLFAATKAADNTMADVLHWIATSEFDEPTNLLDGSHLGGTTAATDSIQSVKGADQRFVSSLLQKIATALDPWQEPQVAGATMGESRISADWLLSGANTLYVVAPANDQRRLSGLFAALVSHIVAGAYERSAKTGRPIEPALLLALDEVCNIAPLPNLDEIASTGPGQGVHLLCVLQNISRATTAGAAIAPRRSSPTTAHGCSARASGTARRSTTSEAPSARRRSPGSPPNSAASPLPGRRPAAPSTDRSPLRTASARRTDRAACSSTAASRPRG